MQIKIRRVDTGYNTAFAELTIPKSLKLRQLDTLLFGKIA